MELRFAVTDRATHHLGNLVVFEAFHIMQYKNRSVTRRQAIDGALQLQTIDRPRQLYILGAELFPRSVVIGFQSLFERNHRQSLLAQLHEDYVYGHAMQPGGEGRLAAK